jgi:thymidylate synthase
MNSPTDEMNYVDFMYTSILKDIVDFGTEIESRNAKTIRLRNQLITFRATPLVTIRKTAWKNALREFEWFMSGSSNIADLDAKVQPWWKPWANKTGDIFNNYSQQFRNFSGRYGQIDQIKYMVDTLKNDPNSRRNVITTWNTADMTHSLTPITNCHGSLIQAFVEPSNNTVHLTMNQRSADMVLGVPHNFIQYWAFLMYLAHQSGRNIGTLTWIGGDCHIYPDHINTVKEMTLVHEDQRHTYDIPNMSYNPTSDEFKADDFSLDSEYKPLITKSLKMTV